MKKIMCLLVMFTITIIPAFASWDTEIINNIPENDPVEKQLEYLYPQLAEAQKTNDLDLMYKIVVDGYKFKKTGNPTSIKLFNDMFSAFAIKFSADRYEITKDKKYLKQAFKWSKLSVKNKTSQVYSIEADIMLSSAFLDIDEMKKAYDLYRAVDFVKAVDLYKEYSNLLESAIAYKNERTQIKKDNWRTGIGVFLLGVSRGAQSFSNSMNSTNYVSQPVYNPPCQTITPAYVPTNQRVDLYVH